MKLQLKEKRCDQLSRMCKQRVLLLGNEKQAVYFWKVTLIVTHHRCLATLKKLRRDNGQLKRSESCDLRYCTEVKNI